MRGEPPLPPFKYFDKGSLAVIGRWAAVANAFGVRLWGLPAWIVWAFIHLAYLVQFQSRILVFIKWGIQDLTFSRAARLLTGPRFTDFDREDEVSAAANATRIARSVTLEMDPG